ncbi:hypothetical protein [Pseudomonas sp. P105]|uniref:hypothetical protein n=1 Tax=Pseudomonas sp. P105 TaxID=3049542 RepID=UPI0039774A47
MGLFAGGELLFQSQALVLLGLLLNSCRLGYLIQRLRLDLGRLRQFPVITPRLDLPGQHRRAAGHQRQQHSDAKGAGRKRHQTEG